jgi:DNA repair/transcription protein MET18/MMS19
LQYKPGGVAETLLCDASDIGPPRAAIGAILTNKHKGGPSTPDPESQTIKKVLEFWGNQIKEATTSTTTANPEAFTALNNIAMHIFAGAIARQDKNVANLVVPVIHEAISSEHANGEIVARSAGALVRVGSSELLSSENHGVVRRLYKQWIYNILVKSLYQDALPAADQDPARSGRHTTAILSIVSECPFKVYEEDLEPLSRLLITALNRPARGSEGLSSGLQTAASALQVLNEILANEPTTLEGHLEAVINGAVLVYGECSPKNKVSSSKSMVQCRKLVLQLLGALPQKFEERHLLSSSRKLQRMLALACGDAVRELRAVARQARANWEKLV